MWRVVPLVMIAVAALAQPISFGVKGGVPITAMLDTRPTFISYDTATNRYIVGPTVEVQLPFGFRVEADALYRHFNYSANFGSITSVLLGIGTLYDGRTTGNAWEFPLLVKYALPSKLGRLYVSAGIAWSQLTGLHEVNTRTVGFHSSMSVQAPVTTVTELDRPVELQETTVKGFAAGTGLELHALILRVSPEIRYVRWGSRHFNSADGGLLSNRNQVEFLVGVTF